ncbi:MAG TPA: hypothetical protein VGG60_02940 [Candidatus Binataceae bacterium]
MDKVLSGFASVGRWLRREVDAARPVFIFFLIAFLLLLSIIKLVLVNFSVGTVALLPKAIVGALFAAKAVLILDETPFAHHLDRYRRIVAVTAKTLLYGAITLMLGYLERYIEALHRTHHLEAAAQYVAQQASIYKLLAWALGITVIFAMYFALAEISEYLGKGKLREIFFESPKTATASSGTRTAI